MAALSRKHLAAAGDNIELLCYPDTAGGPAWLWGQALPEIDPSKYDRLVVIGDRPDDGAAAQMLDVARRWRTAGAVISLLNRYEANWPRFPALLALGVEAVLGGDWGYFWGDALGPSDMAWGRVAALCTRDPIQPTAGLTDAEQALAQGFLKIVYDSQPASDTEGWVALAEPILDLIQADNRSYFIGAGGRLCYDLCAARRGIGRRSGGGAGVAAGAEPWQASPCRLLGHGSGARTPRPGARAWY